MVVHASIQAARGAIIASLSRGDVVAAKSFIKAALGRKDDEQIEKLRHLVTQPNGPGFALSNSQKLDYLDQLCADASELTKALLRDPNCFTPNAGSHSFGKFWGLLNTRNYISLLIAISQLAESMNDYQLAYDYDLRVLTYNSGDNTGTRSHFNLMQTKLNKDLEAFNFSMHLLNQHLEYDHVMEGFEGTDYPRIVFNTIKKEDIDPQSTQIHPSNDDLNYVDSAILFTGALALFKLFGPCPKANSWLAKGHENNIHILAILMHPDSPSYPTQRFNCPRSRASYVEAADFVIFTGRQFCTPEVQEWLRSTSDDMPKRRCDHPECGKVENYLGQWRRCTGCFEVYYCSEECQKKHWTDAHKAPCKEAKRWRNMMF